MGRSLSGENSVISAAFQSSLLRSSLVVIGLLALLAIAWNLLRAAQLRRASTLRVVEESPAADREPVARRVLRLGFGALWLFDAVLQTQGSMPLGLGSGVLQPSAESSPAWVRDVVGVAVTTWTKHPVTAAAAAVWIQAGVGLLLLVAPRGAFSRLAGIASALWGLVVWVFGEAFGGLFAPGLSFLFGAPGAALLYVAAGVVLALPERWWSTPALGRSVLRVLGLFYLAMAVLQAWPGRGFWQGAVSRGHPAGTLTAMVRTMAAASQPAWLSSLLSGFGRLDAGHGAAINLVAVLALAAIGALLAFGGRRVLFAAVLANAAFCALVWVFVQDLGFLGGTGTDPNSMVPLVLWCCVGYLGVTRPAAAPASPPAAASRGWAFFSERPAYALRGLAGLAALAVIGLGAVPVAVAALNPVADPILTEAINGPPNASDLPLLSFSLEDQHGRTVTAASLRGKAVALTFLDPVCTTDCPLIAQEFRSADALLGRRATSVELVAVVANPAYRSVATLRAFDTAEHLDGLANWHYLTGSLPALTDLWNEYSLGVALEPAGAMAAHADVAYLVDPEGRVRKILTSDPGSTAALHSSYSGLLASELGQLVGR